jgi:uncharacterized repeat protein (TIGR01451 family)
MQAVAPAVASASVPQNASGPQNPALYLEKVGPALVALGKPIAYEIIARNTGSVTLCNLHVEDEFPSGAHLVGAEPRPDVRGEQPVWNLGNLEPGAERRIKVEMQPSGEGDQLTRATATFSVSSAVVTHVTRPKLTLTQAGPEAAQVGDPVLFQIQVSNVGTGAAAGVVLHEHLPTGLWHEQGSNIDADIGTVGPGETRSVVLQVKATSAGRQLVEAMVTGEYGLQTAAQSMVVVCEPLLTMQQTAPRRRLLGRPTEFSIEVANPGNAPATNVQVVDALPEGLECVGVSEGGSLDAATRSVVWKIPALGPGQRSIMTFKATPRSAGDLVCRAVARADRALEARADTSVHAEGIAALLLEVVDLDDPIEVGGETTYEIRVLNQGTSASTGIRVIATVPDGMGLKDASGPTGHKVQGQQVAFEAMAKLAPKADIIYRVKVIGQQPGDLRFKVELSSDDLSQPVHEEQSTKVYRD